MLENLRMKHWRIWEMLDFGVPWLERGSLWGTPQVFGLLLHIICRKAHEKRADEMKEQRKEALKVMDQQREVRQKVLADIGEAAKKLINCSEEKENMDIAAVEALHQAEAGLRSLSIVMRQAAVFWKHMEVKTHPA